MRLVTRSDFDGLCCGAVLKHKGIIDTWVFVHPKDMQDGAVDITSQDVIANVPYVPGCAMWFDHHATEINENLDVPGERRLTPSCARIVYEYYGGEAEMPHFKELIEACDKVDSGDLTAEEIQNPPNPVLFGFLVDPRTGLGRFRNFRISNLDLMLLLLDKCATMSIDEILELPDVKERVEMYNTHTEAFKEMVTANSYTWGNVLVTDLRDATEIPVSNRFMVYSMYPECNVSLWIVDGRAKRNVSIAIGYSTVNKTCKSNVGEICRENGGGGHTRVGTCQVDNRQASDTIAKIIKQLIEK